MSERTAPLFLRVKCIPRVYGRLNSGRGWGIAQMPIIPLERELARARQILSSWTGFKRRVADTVWSWQEPNGQLTARTMLKSWRTVSAPRLVRSWRRSRDASAIPISIWTMFAGALGLLRRYVQELLKGDSSQCAGDAAECGHLWASRTSFCNMTDSGQKRRFGAQPILPVYPDERTFVVSGGMSQTGPKWLTRSPRRRGRAGAVLRFVVRATAAACGGFRGSQKVK